MVTPMATPNHNGSGGLTNGDGRRPTGANWDSLNAARAVDRSDRGSMSSGSTDHKFPDMKQPTSTEPGSPGEAETPVSRKPSFFDVGGLLEHDSPSSPQSASSLLDSRQSSRHDFAKSQRGLQPPQQGSRAFIADVGGLLSTHREEGDPDGSTASASVARRRSSPHSGPPRNFSRGSSAYTGRPGIVERAESNPQYRPGQDVGPSTSDASGGIGQDSMDFVDVGGLLK